MQKNLSIHIMNYPHTHQSVYQYNNTTTTIILFFFHITLATLFPHFRGQKLSKLRGGHPIGWHNDKTSASDYRRQMDRHGHGGREGLPDDPVE